MFVVLTKLREVGPGSIGDDQLVVDALNASIHWLQGDRCTELTGAMLLALLMCGFLPNVCVKHIIVPAMQFLFQSVESDVGTDGECADVISDLLRGFIRTLPNGERNAVLHASSKMLSVTDAIRYKQMLKHLNLGAAINA